MRLRSIGTGYRYGRPPATLRRSIDSRRAPVENAPAMATYVGLVLSMLFYGVSFVSTKVALTALGPTSILWIRLALSSLFLVALDRFLPDARTQGAGARGRAAHPPRWPRPADLPGLLLLVLFQPVLYFLAETYGLRTVSAGIGSIIIATIPVFTPVVAAPILGERIRPLTVLGLLVSLAGVVVIVVEPQMEAQYTAVGLALVFAAVFAAVGYTVAVRRVTPHLRPLSIVKMQSLLGLPVMLAIALVVEGVPRSLPEPVVLAHLAFLGVFPSSLAFVFLSGGIRKLGANRANVFVNLVPAFTAVTAWLLLGERFTTQKLVGMAVVVAGVLVAQRAGGRRAAG